MSYPVCAEGANEENRHVCVVVRNEIQIPVVQKVHIAIHRINHCPLDSAVKFPNAYPLDSE